MNEKKPPPRPFFARFLEEQELDEVRGAAGAGVTSIKGGYDWEGPMPVTMKYPSDEDDRRPSSL
jgi:hypothetical protein